MAINLVALKAELDNDPLSLGYSTQDDVEVVATLNLIRASIQVDNYISSLDAVEAVDPADYPTAGNQQNLRDMWRDVLLGVAGAGTINANATNLKAKVQAIFAPGSNTRANLAALQTRDGSRAEQLGFTGVTPSDVADARRLP